MDGAPAVPALPPAAASAAPDAERPRIAAAPDPAPAAEAPSAAWQAPAPPPADAPAPAAPARASAPVPWPARQVAPFVVALALGPDSRLELTLEPGELGRVDVAIERSGGEAVVSLRAERPETLALLQRDRAELERALSDAGLGGEGRGASLSFGLGGEGAARRERRDARPPAHAAPHRDAIAATPAGAPPRGLIDLAF
jgi:hypothetical protein